MATQDVNSFKFWANKIIPLVYDDSLSYYEFLCKVMQKLNEVIGSVNAQNSTIKDMLDQIDAFIAAEKQAREDWELTETANRAAWELQQAQKMAAFELLFVSDYDSTKSYTAGNVCRHEGLLYAANGSTTGSWNSAKWDQIVLADYLANYVQTAAADMQAQYDSFLETYQREFGIVKTVGSSTTDVISQSGVSQYIQNSQSPDNYINWTTVLNDMGIQSSSGEVVNYSNAVATDFIDVSAIDTIRFINCFTYALYDTNKDYISGGQNPTSLNKPSDAVYVRCTVMNANVGKAAVLNESKYLKGISTVFPELSTKAFRATLTMEQAGFSTIANINRDGCYTFTSATAPADLPDELQSQAGSVYSCKIGTYRLFIAIGFNTTNPRIFIKYTYPGTTWFEPNMAMVSATSIAGSDFDNYKESGRCYYFSASDISSYANKPFSSSGVLWIYRASNRIIQIAVSNVFDNGKKTIAIRSRLNNLSWTEWYILDAPAQPYSGKIINWIGDSIVAGDDFDEIVAAYFGMTLNDYGVSGATIAKKPDGFRSCISETYSDMTDTCDIIAVSCGTNDFQYDWTDFGTISDATNETFYGALNVLCLGLITKYPDKIIFFTTPIKRAQDPYTTIDSQNTKGKTLADYAAAIKEVCARYSIPVLDMYAESMLNPSIPAQAIYFDNVGTHPNATGKQIMARRVIGWLRQLC